MSSRFLIAINYEHLEVEINLIVLVESEIDD